MEIRTIIAELLDLESDVCHPMPDHLEAIKAARLILGRVDVEEIGKIIEREELMPTPCEDSGQCEWTVGEVRALAKVIIGYLESGE